MVGGNQSFNGSVMNAPAQPLVGVATPCTKICVLDPQSGLCRGCSRTATEIAGWLGFSAEQRATVMRELPQRRALAAVSENSIRTR
jgi:hypothetical protein